MIGLLYAFVIALLLVAISNTVKENLVPGDTVPMRASDGFVYYVNPNLHDPEGAAELIAEINRRIFKLMRHLKKKYSVSIDQLPSNAKCPEKVRQIRELLRRFNPDVIFESDPNNSKGDTSYTINKGKILALCLRPKSNPDTFHDINLLMFVALHEISHYIAPIYDHKVEFWITFKFILKEAESIGIIKLINYRENPTVYCSVPVRHSPAFDDSLIDLCRTSK